MFDNLFGVFSTPLGAAPAAGGLWLRRDGKRAHTQIHDWKKKADLMLGDAIIP